MRYNTETSEENKKKRGQNQTAAATKAKCDGKWTRWKEVMGKWCVVARKAQGVGAERWRSWASLKRGRATREIYKKIQQKLT